MIFVYFMAFTPSRLKEFAGYNFRLNENGGKFSEKVENDV